MNYLDFELRIGAGNGIEYPITVVHSAAGGEPSIQATLPVHDGTLQLQLDELQRSRSAQSELHRAEAHSEQGDIPPPQIDEAAAAKSIGRLLFESLIIGTVRDAYVSSLGKARQQDVGLRLRLSVDSPEVAALPWEFLYDPQEGDHVSLLRDTPLTRYTALPRGRNIQSIKPPLRILGMISDPTNMPRLDVTREQNQLELALEHRIERGDVELGWVENGTWLELQNALQGDIWHIFHFIGHGGFNSGADEGLLVFCNEQGSAQLMPATHLGRLFSGHRSLLLAFLNACEGGRTSYDELFSSVGAVLTRRGIPAVISMQFDITDRAALEFSRLFYDGLARGNPIDVAVTEARTGISFNEPASIEWATPMLHMHTPNGQLFSVNNSASIFDESKPIPRSAVNNAEPCHSTPSSTVNSDIGRQARRGLDILSRKVVQYWIHGILEHSLFLQTLHDLGIEMMVGAVENPWGTELERPGEPSQTLAADQSLVDIFDEYGGSLLILGEPGSGKTTVMLDLVRRLFERLDQENRVATPVVFNLSSWSPQFTLLEEWMADQMSRHYQIPRVSSRQLLDNGTILPLLDGLDETGSDVRERCIEAINGYVLERSQTGLVICCRLKEYSSLSIRLALNTAVRLTELEDQQIDTYLSAAGNQLAGLRALLRRETAMRFDARSPLWLNLMVRAYHGLSEDDLTRESDQSAAARRRQLMDDYMARMFRKARGRA